MTCERPAGREKTTIRLWGRQNSQTREALKIWRAWRRKRDVAISHVALTLPRSLWAGCTDYSDCNSGCPTMHIFGVVTAPFFEGRQPFSKQILQPDHMVA